MIEDVAREIGNRRRAVTDGCKVAAAVGVAHAKPDDEDALRVVRHQQRHVRERAHVALRERPRRRHRVAVGHQAPSLARRLGDGDDLVDAFALIEHALVRLGLRQRTRAHEIRRQQQPRR